MAEAIEALEREVGGVGRLVRLIVFGRHELCAAMRRGASEYDKHADLPSRKHGNPPQ